MKKLYVFFVILVLALAAQISMLFAQGAINCPCGYGEGGCLTCAEEEKDIKRVPDIDPKEYKICRCGYEESGNCVPCKEPDKDKNANQDNNS